MANIFIVTALSTKDRASANVNLDSVAFVDVDNNKIAYASMQQSKIESFNTKLRRYINDEVNLEDSVGTLAFVNKEYKFYGILRQLGNKLKIVWISEDNLLKDKNYSKIANIHNEPVDITDKGFKVFNVDWSVIKSVFVSEVNYKMISKEKFIESLKQTNTNESLNTDEEIEIVEEPAIEENNEQEQTIINSNKSNEESINKIDLDLVKRLVELEKREEAVKQREKDIEEKYNRLSSILAKAETVDVEKAIGAIVDADNISTFNSSKVAMISKSDLANEFALKMANNGDIVSISKEYLAKLTCLTRKTLESNTTYTVCKLFISMKFERASEYSIFGIIDIDENENFVKFKILKAYSNSGITESEIGQFHLDYLKERKAYYNR